ncbi:ABC transporter related protein [Gemmatirosa kalamazoonensis]|uniref:ABC transporter related protein n=1 Tax=Gemmatirosa kalamazoonensis TaxID=861299 RepID=W0RHA4_9BACT|nr:ABC-F family ATP-binding cassette domain-containing protein [Gemmatirosa kalamazoonensis]AHG88773.1 ABC transporter related protein [Gemmatirosa kalamazoonensis]
MTQLAISNVAVEFGATTLFQDITFTIGAGDRWGVIGRNGTGKTTLFKLLTGELQPSRGQIARQPGVRVTLLEQHRDFGGATTVWEAVAGAFGPLLALERSLAQQADALAHTHDDSAMERYGRDLERFEREGGYTYAARVDAVLDGLGFDPDGARTRLLATLSGGERGRVGLARQLVLPGEVLLLDEPTNHLDLETTRWLEGWLQGTDRTVVLVSHDRAFLAAVVDHVLHFEGGSATPYVGGYEAFVQQREERRLAQQRQFDKQSKVVAAEEDYIRRNIAGQNSKQAKGRRKRLARMARLSAPIGDEAVMALRLEIADRGGDQVIVAEKASVGVPSTLHAPRSTLARPERGAWSVEGSRILIEDFSVRLTRGEVVGFIGPNGAGKSTLLKVIVGETGPLAGQLRVGDSIRVAYYSQNMAQLPLDRTLYEVISDLRPLWERRLVQGHLGRFGFSGDEVQRRVGTLSGGERARVALAAMMLTRANFLVLDEPTNHLDVESIEALEDALDDYEGTVLLVSHDRALLRALATQVWVLHDRHVTVFDGSFEEWETASKEREHAAAVHAAEEEALRRVKERERMERTRREAEAQAVAPNDRRGVERDQRRAARDAQKRVEQSERRIAELEAKVAALTTALDDPALYGTPDGVRKAADLGKSLDTAKAALDAALEEWTAATEAVESSSV